LRRIRREKWFNIGVASAGVMVVLEVVVVAAAAGISMKRNSTIRKRKLEDSLLIT
jgi:hypothetical protein